MEMSRGRGVSKAQFLKGNSIGVMRGQAKILLWGRMDIFWNAQYYLAHIQADNVQLMCKKAFLAKISRVNGSS